MGSIGPTNGPTSKNALKQETSPVSLPTAILEAGKSAPKRPTTTELEAIVVRKNQASRRCLMGMRLKSNFDFVTEHTRIIFDGSQSRRILRAHALKP